MMGKARSSRVGRSSSRQRNGDAVTGQVGGLTPNVTYFVDQVTSGHITPASSVATGTGIVLDDRRHRDRCRYDGHHDLPRQRPALVTIEIE